MRLVNDGWYLSKGENGENVETKSSMVMHANVASGDADFVVSILVGEKHPVSPEHSHSEGSIHLSFEQARELSEWLTRTVAMREDFLTKKASG